MYRKIPPCVLQLQLQKPICPCCSCHHTTPTLSLPTSWASAETLSAMPGFSHNYRNRSVLLWLPSHHSNSGKGTTCDSTHNATCRFTGIRNGGNANKSDVVHFSISFWSYLTAWGLSRSLTARRLPVAQTHQLLGHNDSPTPGLMFRSNSYSSTHHL